MFYNNNTENLSKLLKILRKETNKKLDEFSSGVCSIAHLSKIENGKFKPDIDLMYDLFTKNGYIIHEDKELEYKLRIYINEFFEYLNTFDVEKIKEIYNKIDKNSTETDGNLNYSFHIKFIRMIYNMYFGEKAYAFKTATELKKYEFLFQEYLTKEYYFYLALCTYFFHRFNEMKMYVVRLHEKFQDSMESYFVSGIYHVERNDTISALENLRKAKMMYESVDRKSELAMIEMEFAKIYVYEDEKRSIRHFENAIKYVSDINLDFLYEFLLHKFIVYLNENGKYKLVLLMAEKMTYNTSLSNYPVTIYCVLDSLFNLRKFKEIDNMIPEVRNRVEEMGSYYRGMFVEAWIKIYLDEDDVEDYIKKAFKTYKELEFELPIYRLGRFLGAYYEQKRSYKKAMMYYKLAMRKGWYFARPISEIKIKV